MDKLSDVNGNPLTYKDIAKKGKNAAKVQLKVPVVSLIQSSPIFTFMADGPAVNIPV